MDFLWALPSSSRKDAELRIFYKIPNKRDKVDEFGDQCPGREAWSGLPFPSPGDLLNSGIKPRSPTLQADALLSEPPGKPKICFILFNRKLISKTLLQGDNHMGIK